MGARRRCCCECREYADDFDRADSGSLGDDWELVEVDADWDIDTNRAKAVSGTALWVQPMPDRFGSMIISVDMLDVQDGDVWEVLFAWKDENNYYFVRVEPKDGSPTYVLADTWTVSIGKVVGGVETKISDHDILVSGCEEQMRVNNIAPIVRPATVNHSVQIFFDRDTVRVVDGTTTDMWACLGTPDPTADRVGLRRPDSNTRDLLWDNFTVKEHNITNSSCYFRSCGCGQYNCLPNTLTGTMTHYSGDEAGQIDDPVEITLKRRAYRDVDLWVSEPGIEGYDYMGAGPECFGFILQCAAGTGTGDAGDQPIWSLEWTANADCTTGSCFDSVVNNADLTNGTLVSSECDPLSLVFELDMQWDSDTHPTHYDALGDDYNWGVPPDLGGKYRFTITE